MFVEPVAPTRPSSVGAACLFDPAEQITIFVFDVKSLQQSNKQVLNLLLAVPPMEDSIGSSGSGCDYGGIRIQIDPFPRAVFEKQRQPTWIVVPAVGDISYFRDNQGMWAELYMSAGPHVVTIQMDIPDGRTAASIQSNAVALAKAILSKLS